MTSALKAGDEVVLLRVPEWLIHDLPESEKREIIAYVGKTMTIEKLDQHGYYWVGFGSTVDVGGETQYSGHSLCVPAECLERA